LLCIKNHEESEVIFEDNNNSEVNKLNENKESKQLKGGVYEKLSNI